jgi:superfamily II DNA/RNA helicase
VKRIAGERLTLLFSATLPAHIVKLSEKYLRKPERIAVGSDHAPIEKIQQELVHLPVAEKYAALLAQLERRKGSVIVFVRTKRGADRLAKKLTTDRHSAEAIHGNLSQNRRTRVIEAFRAKKHRVMVATDVAARGLDIPHIEHVVNYDLPQCPEDYIHRIGRTARAGAEGAAVCFITPEDHDLWRDIHLLMNPGARLEAPRAKTGKSPAPPRQALPSGKRRGVDRSFSRRKRADNKRRRAASAA